MAIYGTGDIDEFGLAGTNNPGDLYTKAPFNNDENILIQRYVRSVIFDAMPQQFKDLALFNMQTSKSVPSDSIEYQEMGYQREPIEATATAAAATWPATQTVTVASTDNSAKDLIVVYPTNEKGTITGIDKGALTITVTPMTGLSVPAVAVADKLTNHSPVEGDSKEGFSNYFRATTVERYNYVMMISKAMRFGRMELAKYMRAGTTSDYLAKNRSAMFGQTRIDISNNLWNGERGEVTLEDGTKAKTAGGMYPLMVAAGSPNATATNATLREAFEDILLQTEYGDYGEEKFIFLDNKHHLALSKLYKDEKIRYRPEGDMTTNLVLDAVSIGSSLAVFVPMHRLADDASFPSAFADRIFITDPKSLRRCQVFGERSGEIDDRSSGAAKNYKEMFVDLTFSLKINNPLAFGWIDLS